MVIHLLLTIGPDWLWHPLGQCAGNVHEVLRCKSYNFHSGIAANFGELAIVASILGGAWGFYKHRQCAVESPGNCRRIGHRVPGTSLYACDEHHPHGQGKGGRTAEDILKHHEDSGA